MFAILIAFRRWRSDLTGKHLRVHCDNGAVVNGLKKLSIRGPAIAPLRQIALIIAKEDIQITPVWINTNSNTLADLLSRFRFRQIADFYPQLKNLRPLRQTR